MSSSKSFIKPDNGYGDITYDTAYNSAFDEYLERIQYNAFNVFNITNSVFNITEAMQGSSMERFYRELDLESFQLFS